MQQRFLDFENLVERLPFPETFIIDQVAAVKLTFVKQGEELIQIERAVLLAFLETKISMGVAAVRGRVITMSS